MSDLGNVLLDVAVACGVVCYGIVWLRRWVIASRKLARLEREATEAAEARLRDSLWRSTEDQTALLGKMAGSVDAALRVMVESAGATAAVISAMESLTQAVTKASPDLTRISDNTFLVAKGARDLGDSVTALRAVVFDGKRPQDFPITMHDDERVQRAEVEYDISQLMIDHNLSRADATARIRDNYAGRSMR